MKENTKDKWYRTSKSEIETFIHFDEEEANMCIYTTRAITACRLEKVLGAGKKTMFRGKICSEEWNIPYEDINSMKNLLRYKIYIPKKQNNKEEGDN